MSNWGSCLNCGNPSAESRCIGCRLGRQPQDPRSLFAHSSTDAQFIQPHPFQSGYQRKRSEPSMPFRSEGNMHGSVDSRSGNAFSGGNVDVGDWARNVNDAGGYDPRIPYKKGGTKVRFDMAGTREGMQRERGYEADGEDKPSYGLFKDWAGFGAAAKKHRHGSMYSRR